MEQLTELKDQASNVRKDILSLKQKMHELYEKKEEWYSKKDEIKATVSTLIDEIRKIKAQLDTSRDVKERIRRERDTYNNKFRELIATSKQLVKEKRDLIAKLGIRGDIERLRQNISHLETKIETEALSFAAEKKVMMKINELRKKLHDAASIDEVNKKINLLSAEIDEAKKKGDEEHQKLVAFIQAERENYTKFIELSKKINDLKKLQQEAFSHFKALKDEFSETNLGLQKKLLESSSIFGVISKAREKKINETRERQFKTMAEKTHIVEEKLKNKKKLTTEDLIVFQGMKTSE